MAQTYFLMHVESRFQFEKIPHSPFKGIENICLAVSKALFWALKGRETAGIAHNRERKRNFISRKLIWLK